MSTFAKYSRWIVATLLFTFGVHELLLIETGSGFAQNLADLFAALVWILAAVATARWERVALPLAIAVCAFNVAEAFIGPGRPSSNFVKWAMGATLILVITWFNLPQIRDRFTSGGNNS